jgi:hypothetical protein
MKTSSLVAILIAFAVAVVVFVALEAARLRTLDGTN